MTSSDQTIACAMTGLSQTANATVSWKDPDGATISDGDNYTVVDGTVNGSGEQESTLTIKTTKLQTLGTASVFTCVVTSGMYPASEAASNTSCIKYNDSDHPRSIYFLIGRPPIQIWSSLIEFITNSLTADSL